MRDIKVNFSRFYNRRHNRRGYFWGDRFKSVIVDRGETLVNCLAYIDLNPPAGRHRQKAGGIPLEFYRVSYADRKQGSVSVHRFRSCGI